MSVEELLELRKDLLSIPQEELVDLFIKLRERYIWECEECERLEEELEKIRDNNNYLEELIDEIPD